MCASARNQKFTKTPILEVQGRSLKVIHADTPKKLIISACLYPSVTVFTLDEPIEVKERF